jgi:hypothetical protein
MICLNPFVFLKKIYILDVCCVSGPYKTYASDAAKFIFWMSAVFQVHIKLKPLMLPKGNVQCIPAADIFEESLDTQDVPEETDRLSVTEIAVSISFGSMKFKMSTL